MASSDYFLKLDGIDGESIDDKHKGEIEVASFSWGASNPGRPGFGGGAGSGKVSFQDFHFVKTTDKASPTLLKSCATGVHIKKATLTVRKAGRDQQEYLKINLQDIVVSSFEQKADGEAEVDSFSLSFADITVAVFGQRPDGSTDGTIG